MKVLIALILFVVTSPSWAGDLEWSGLYRFEGYHIKNSELSDQKRSKDYGLHHLILRPKIVAADGLTIYSQFNIFNIDDGSGHYNNSQMGQVWGSGIGEASPNNTTSRSSNSMAENQEAETFQVSELYLTLNQEFGQLLIGRAPLQFGLGMTHNAGRGLFDHWYDTRDQVAYKVVMGNLSVTPIYAKVNEGGLNKSDDISEWMIQLEYESPSTGTEMGVFYQARKAGDQGNDHPTNGDVIGGTGASIVGRQSTNTLNIYALRDVEEYRLGIEASFMDGETGVFTSTGQDVGLSGFGIAGEVEYRPSESKWKWGLKGGLASGDNPSTAGEFEGYAFDRNYDIAMLMFNHPLGKSDFLRSGLYHGGPQLDGTSSISSADTEVLSNVMYFAPSAYYQWKDRWAFESVLVTGWLQEDAVANQLDKSLGYELDLSLHFEPKKGVRWINQLGLLFPGSAFEGDGTSQSKFSYGIGTKAAISF